jgi:hypothetical protein
LRVMYGTRTRLGRGAQIIANTVITPPGAEKFFIPPPPQFLRVWAWGSVLSLLVFLAASLHAWSVLRMEAWWVILPFAFTSFGSGVGLAYESWLLWRGRPYQLGLTEQGRWIQALRIGNLAVVFGATYLLFALLTYGQSAEALWLSAGVGLITGFLLVLFLFQGPLWVAATTLSLGLILQLLLVLTSLEISSGVATRWVLGLAAAGLFATVLIGSETPQRSTTFHLLATCVMRLMLLAIPTCLRMSWQRSLRRRTCWRTRRYSRRFLPPPTQR